MEHFVIKTNKEESILDLHRRFYDEISYTMSIRPYWPNLYRMEEIFRIWKADWSLHGEFHEETYVKQNNIPVQIVIKFQVFGKDWRWTFDDLRGGIELSILYDSVGGPRNNRGINQ